MKLKLIGLISLFGLTGGGLTTSGALLAGDMFSPWGVMNDVGPWDASDVVRQQQQEARRRAARAQPSYPTRPKRTLRQLREFSNPVNQAPVDVNAFLPAAPVFVRRAGVLNYDIQVRIVTPDYRSLTVVGYLPEAETASKDKQLELTCEIETIRRWDQERTRGWGVRVAETFMDEGTVSLVENAKTVLMTHGLCFPTIDVTGQLAPQGIYEYHAAFVSEFADSEDDKANKAAAMMEIGTGLHFTTAGNGWFEKARVQLAFTSVSEKENIQILYK